MAEKNYCSPPAAPAAGAFELYLKPVIILTNKQRNACKECKYTIFYSPVLH